MLPFLITDQHQSLKIRLINGAVLSLLASDMTRLQTLYLSLMNTEVITSTNSDSSVLTSNMDKEEQNKTIKMWKDMFGKRRK